MPRLSCLWLGLLLMGFSHELNQDLGRARKLCGRHLLKEIVKLCGSGDWSKFHFEEQTPLQGQISGKSGSTAAFIPNQFGVKPAFPPTASQDEGTNDGKLQSLPQTHHKRAEPPPPLAVRAVPSSSDSNPDTQELIQVQKESTNRIKTLSSVFWGNHPQRRRRGYSEKCCLKGCTKQELGIACLPYIDFNNLKAAALLTELF
ncbi:insulin-like peptide INSL6 [Ochotona curzoniae]|uniref:insulin-like peptide INSL6 n=1 Tax=Ochotona curzoniae TaxID=130825 RepID=UPI001B34A850|nr:insulin-like peptide INSL6 [Ochotona curzoniae]